MKKSAVIAATIAAVVGASWLPASAAEGNWTGGCFSGRICMWNGNYGASSVVSSSVNDSNFSGDFFASGTSLNDHVKIVRNNGGPDVFDARAFTNPSYGGNASICIPDGVIVGPYAIGSGNGVSSFTWC